MTIFPVTQTYTIEVPSEGGIELLLAEAYQIPVGDTSNNEIGHILMGIPDNATDHGLLFSDGSITSGSVESLHLIRTNADYQVSTTGNLKLVVRIDTGAPTNATFKIWKSTTADSATGTPVYDFTNSSTLDDGIFTTPVLEFSVTQNDFINVEMVGGGSNLSAHAWFVEKPAA